MADHIKNGMNIRRNLSVIGEHEVAHPTGFKIKVEIPAEEEVTQTGIIIAKPEERVVKGSDRGTVVEVGPLAGRDKGDCPENWGAVVGWDVIFHRYGGGFVEQAGLNGKKFIFIEEKDVICYIKPEETKEIERNARA